MPNDRTDQSQIDRKAALRDLIRAASRFLDHTKSQFSDNAEWQPLARAKDEAAIAATHLPPAG